MFNRVWYRTRSEPVVKQRGGISYDPPPTWRQRPLASCGMLQAESELNQPVYVPL